MTEPTDQRRPILLLDLRVEARGFFHAENLHDAGERLAAAGLDVRLVRSVEQLRGDRWEDRLQEAVAAIGPRAIVLERAWRKELIDTLKQAGQGGPGQRAPVVRLDDGHPSDLDAQFDAVLTEDALVDWALGQAEGAATSTEFRPTTGELRKRRDAWRGQARQLQFQALEDADVEMSVGRPVIRGPAEGCPFLLDARKNPVFSGLPLDRFQHRGCSFCLDNIGAFAMPTEERAVSAWLEGMRAARARDPGVREVLLADERPHPFLPALFRAMAKDPALHGIELLIKTRVDWLLEFEQTALTEALHAAEAADAVLHAYLVGFESFDAFHLALFNKGVTVADNIAAIGALQRLEAAFPERFVFRKHRAHGIVLFTPWTTPQHLLHNAEVMAEVDFAQLRAGAWRTRLRIYPGLPLHALALRDGLTDVAFPAHRQDRAAEQGYNASVPWRFADPQTELAFAILQQLGWRLERRLGEAITIAVAAQFATLWPALVDCLEHAHLPLLAALIGHGPDALKEATQGGLEQWQALAKDAGLAQLQRGETQHVTVRSPLPGASAGLAQAYEAMGFAARAVDGDAVVVAMSVGALPDAGQMQRPKQRRQQRLDRRVAKALDGGPVSLVNGWSAARWSPVMGGVAAVAQRSSDGAELELWALPSRLDEERGEPEDPAFPWQVAHRELPESVSGDEAAQVVEAVTRWLQELPAGSHEDLDDVGATWLGASLPASPGAALKVVHDALSEAAQLPMVVHPQWRWTSLRLDLHRGRIEADLHRDDTAQFTVAATLRGDDQPALAESLLLALRHSELPDGVAGVEAHAAVDALARALQDLERRAEPPGASSARDDRKEPDDLRVDGGRDRGATVERLTFEAGNKPLLRVERVQAEGWEDAFAADKAAGRWVGVGAHRYDETPAGRVRAEQGRFVDVFVGRSEEDVNAAISADSREKSDNDPDATRELGALLGYPACCTEAFLASGAPGDNDGWMEQVAARSGDGPWPWVLNLLPVGETLVPFMTCRLDCEHAVAYAEKAFSALQEHDPERAERTRLAMQGRFVRVVGGGVRRSEDREQGKGQGWVFGSGDVR